MQLWKYHNPVRLSVGPGVFEQIPLAIAGRTYALVTYPEPVFTDLGRRLAAATGSQKLVITDFHPNPTLDDLRACNAMLALRPDVELIVALGGGSAIDVAKALAVGRGSQARLLAALHGNASSDDATISALKLIAVPTTSGTGSDVTCWATLWDQENSRKLSLDRPDLFPEASFIDPELTVDLPWSITLSSGLDALSHALESLWNHHATPLSRHLAVLGAQTIIRTLPRLRQQPEEIALRTDLSLAALYAGLAFSTTRTALAHSLSYPITLRFGISHGIACSFTLPAVMQAALGSDPRCDDALRQIFGDLASAPRLLARFLADLGVSTDPAAYGVEGDIWQELIGEALAGPRGRNFIASDRPEHVAQVLSRARLAQHDIEGDRSQMTGGR
ncbi:iron-containing alcohol dehydrogenase [Dongia soli]|uniref:Iron-containing alcohol dehydrogenase n=1 Tax=Dongia soli TaxID=600628 RepID=A0ABU5EB69_9PROT|nr:iron-containing alcohol dehydrogenase [Dongia soli]MDY0883433.1 iron-containing alcohol dehydrogenase [Dongia soli]